MTRDDSPTMRRVAALSAASPYLKTIYLIAALINTVAWFNTHEANSFAIAALFVASFMYESALQIYRRRDLEDQL